MEILTPDDPDPLGILEHPCFNYYDSLQLVSDDEEKTVVSNASGTIITTSTDEGFDVTVSGRARHNWYTLPMWDGRNLETELSNTLAMLDVGAEPTLKNKMLYPAYVSLNMVMFLRGADVCAKGYTPPEYMRHYRWANMGHDISGESAKTEIKMHDVQTQHQKVVLMGGLAVFLAKIDPDYQP